MSDAVKYPYLTTRKGTSNLCYKRDVPHDLHERLGRCQIWRTLGTSDRQKAKTAYRKIDSEIDAIFETCRTEHTPDTLGSTPVRTANVVNAPNQLRGVDRQAICREFRDQLIEADFAWRSAIAKQAEADPDALWCGDILDLPAWQKDHDTFGQHTYYEGHLDRVVSDCLADARSVRLETLRMNHSLGNIKAALGTAEQVLADRGLVLCADDKIRLAGPSWKPKSKPSRTLSSVSKIAIAQNL